MGYRDDYFNDPLNKGNRGWYRCVRCGKSFRKGDVDIDHILPRAKGGGDNLENLQCMCKHCNRSKQDDDSDSMEDFKDNMIRRSTNNYSDGFSKLLKWLEDK